MLFIKRIDCERQINMLIKCPKCNVVYKIDAQIFKEGGVKMHCQSCDETFRAYKKDMIDEQSYSSKESKQVFAKMSEKTAPFFEEPHLPETKIRVMHHTRYKHSVNYLLMLLIFVLIASLLYMMRFDVVRFAPKAESMYKKLGIESVYNGKYLDFTHMETSEFVDHNVSKIKISGILKNTSVYEVIVPPVKIVFFDTKGRTILDTTHYLPFKRLGAYYQVPFEAVLTNPTPNQKNIHITFAKDL